MGSGSSKKAKPNISQCYRQEHIAVEAPIPAERKELQPVEESPAETYAPVKEDVVEKKDKEPRQEKTVEEVEKPTLNQSGENFIKTADGFNNSPWPYYNYVKLGYNINGGPGGSTGLAFISCSYGGEGQDTTAELILVKGGVDCNHFASKSLYKDHEGHFGPENHLCTTEDGTFVVQGLFGCNHVRMYTNDSTFCNLRDGVFVYGDEGPTPLPLNVNGARGGQNGGGLTMILCSNVQDGNTNNAIYLVRSGFKDNKFTIKLFQGDDKFKFSVNGDGTLLVQGAPKSKYGMFHNRSNLILPTNHCYVAQTQFIDGKVPEILYSNIQDHATFVVLCSSSNGTEDVSVSAVYWLTVKNGELSSVKEISGLFHKSFTSSDLWSFEVNNERLSVTGPHGPNRYGLLSNEQATPIDLSSSIHQSCCLATGESTKTKGKVKVTEYGVTGEVSKCTPIKILFNHEVACVIPDEMLQQEGKGFTFSYDWKDTEKAVGLHLVRVFALRPHSIRGKDCDVELFGSPYHLLHQKEGVAYALNVAGPAYQAVNDVVYSSEFGQYANFTNEVKDIPNGEYIFRLHSDSKSINMKSNKTDDIKELKNQKELMDIQNFTCYTTEMDVSVKDKAFCFNTRTVDIPIETICGFALLDKSKYQEKEVLADKMTASEKDKLVDTLQPIQNSVTRKKMTIVGWSPNLLVNSSAELGTMENWNVSGDFNIADGGYTTEKCFHTSHMWCKKYQEVRLTDHFDTAYLDTAPDIQVISEYSTGQLGTIYKECQWQKASHTFTGYGPGVTIVGFTSKGKDDKFWGGHFGTIMSGAEVRVKRQTKGAKGDGYEDIETGLIDSFFVQMDLPQDEEFERQTQVPVDMANLKSNLKKRRKKRKKREIRVFVSSTFRDFSKEREEIIKKAFREVNKLCSERGVFFTYVDLRWGITSEQTKDGKTIAICLQEIDRCRPYFICMMGDRFGWCQQEAKVDDVLNMTFNYAIENHPNLQWIEQYRYNSSVTQRYASESEWHHEKQDQLKSRVRELKDEVIIRDFKVATEVADMIKKDLEDSIEEDFPKGTELTKLEQQREAHQAFAAARTRVEVEETEPDTFMFVHFIGCSADSADYSQMLRRLYEEIKTSFSFDMDIPSSDNELINSLPKWLRLASQLTRVILVFDALNQMDDGSGQDGTEHDLMWVPTDLPPNVFILLSTLPGKAMTACDGFGWPSLRVQSLDVSQKEQIITDYLEGIYGKTLNQDQKNMIVQAEQTSNALYLKSLLDEVRMYGSFRTLTDKIQDYLMASNPGDLFAKILSRLEGDFENGEDDRKELVRDSTSAIWCSHRGMSEPELVELLDIKSALWSPFYLSLYENLINRDGIVNFCHDHLRQAVEKKYLQSPEDKRNAYLKLIDFFDKQDINSRTVEEMPFLLTKAGEKDRLLVYISNLQVFNILSQSEEGTFELIKAWRYLGDLSKAETAYLEKLADIPMTHIYQEFDYYSSLYGRLAHFFLQVGLVEAARNVYTTLVEQLEHQYGASHGTIVYSANTQLYTYRCKHPDVIKLCEGLLGLATVYVGKENMAEAKKLLSRSLELSTKILGKRHHFVASTFTRLGQLSYRQGRIEEALAYFLQDLKVTRSEVGTFHPRTAIVLNEIALVFDDRNDELAVKLYEAALKIFLETYGDKYIGTGIIRYNLGAFYFAQNYFSRARYQFEKSYAILNSFLSEDHPDTKAAKEALETVKNI
ncbi:Y7407-like protein [Mya arenaria]|uniref:Y7407-like protein n=1 Tax=Mya arenaria TaxID=6604 RepID=A0ABY7FQY4_MYAAR|nr:Y7407-like protein [Mya arenaria]